MPAASWIVCTWPGLARLWLRGYWIGLLWAMMFALLVDILLVTSFLWPELVWPAFRTAGWVGAGSWWIASGWICWRRRSELSGNQSTEDLFREAQGEYLKGHWLQVESILRRILKHNPRDVEARLMLATALGHSRRFGEAKRELDKLGRLEQSEKWQFEIEHERQRLKQARAETDIHAAALFEAA